MVTNRTMISSKFKKGEVVRINVDLIFSDYVFAKAGDRFRITEINVDDDEMMDYGAINLESKRSKWEMGVDEGEFEKIDREK